MDVKEVTEKLLSQGCTVSVAEACTCGLLGYMQNTVPGSSRYFLGGVIVYGGGLKQKELGVTDEPHDAKGTVSPEMAIAMSMGV